MWDRKESYVTGTQGTYKNKVEIKTGKVSGALCTFGLESIREWGSKVLSRGVTGWNLHFFFLSCFVFLTLTCLDSLPVQTCKG